jgi:predicted DCC family thiol-disulfide oxidoreductase YuxK
VLLFDGVCNFCNASVQFVVKRDLRGELRFASLQSAVGQALLRRHGLEFDEFDTMVLVGNGKCLTRSDAALEVAGHLSWPWRTLGMIARLIPRRLRDACYRAFVRQRYALFGRAEQCMVPAPELRQRFLQDVPDRGPRA